VVADGLGTAVVADATATHKSDAVAIVRMTAVGRAITESIRFMLEDNSSPFAFCN
jgi:hypothetical protein